MDVYEQLLTLLLNSKKGGELPLIDSLANTDYFIVYDESTGLVSRILKSNIGLTAIGGTAYKIPVTIDNNGQTSVTLTSKPDNIDLVVNRANKHQGTDYTYNNQTGELVYPSGFDTDYLIDVTAYQNTFSKKEFVNITSDGQSTFTLSEKPRTINLVLNRTSLSEGTDYTYNITTGLITIINTYYINQITTGSLLEARKIF